MNPPDGLRIGSQYLPKMAKGELIGCFGLTEPDFGSNPGGMVTRAKKDGDHYIFRYSVYETWTFPW